MKRVLLFCFIAAISIHYSCKDETAHFKTPDYKSWKRPVQGVIDTPIPGHGATFRIIYANETAFQSRVVTMGGIKKIQMNDGSVIVKEVYEKREDVGYRIPVLFVMTKDSGERDSINGWEYYMKKPGEGWIEVKGRMCVGCHEAANERHPYFDGNQNNMFRDYLFVKIAK